MVKKIHTGEILYDKHLEILEAPSFGKFLMLKHLSMGFVYHVGMVGVAMTTESIAEQPPLMKLWCH